MGDRKRIGVKYCGGCNPTYERTEGMGRIRSFFEDRAVFLTADQPNLDILLCLNGCFRTCALEHSSPSGIPCWSITQEEDFKRLIQDLKALL